MAGLELKDMQRFRLKYDNEKLFITHSIYPECVIEVIQLARQAFWDECADWGSIFDFFVLRQADGDCLFQLLIVEYNEVDTFDAGDVSDDEVPEYRALLRKAWKWFLFRYLLGPEDLPGMPRQFGFDAEPEDERAFSVQDEDGIRYVYHRMHPVFRARLKPEQDAGGILDDIEWLEEPDVDDVPGLLSKMGDWISKYL